MILAVCHGLAGLLCRLGCLCPLSGDGRRWCSASRCRLDHRLASRAYEPAGFYIVSARGASRSRCGSGLLRLLLYLLLLRLRLLLGLLLRLLLLYLLLLRLRLLLYLLCGCLRGCCLWRRRLLLVNLHRLLNLGLIGIALKTVPLAVLLVIGCLISTYRTRCHGDHPFHDTRDLLLKGSISIMMTLSIIRNNLRFCLTPNCI